jgi:hypothetical protein
MSEDPPHKFVMFGDLGVGKTELEDHTVASITLLSLEKWM